MIALNEETSTEPTEPRFSTATKLARISWLSARDPNRRFDALMHLVDRETLTACFHELDGKKAVGADKVTKEAYGERLEENIEGLLERMRRMAYRPRPMRRVLIPKEGKPGATRPIDIGNLEDKLVQKALAKVLEAIYEPLFRSCSYGFRPGRGCHDAIRDLYLHLYRRPVNAILDVDLANYFGSIRPQIVADILREKIGDERLVRYIMRMLKAGVLAGGELQVSEDGVPQGSPLSPVLANVVAHFVIDEWFERIVKAHCRGHVALFRYADDMVICCELAQDVDRIRQALRGRLERYGLAMNEEKTRTVPFSRSKASDGGAGTFDFLGFTFYLGKSKRGHYTPRLRTSRKRFTSKLKRVNTWMRDRRSLFKLVDLWRALRQKLAGHIAYFAVSFNLDRVGAFVHHATQIFFRWLNRRGGRRKTSWEKFQLLMQRFPLPQIRIRHHLYTVSQPAQR
jgi:RNA-directed DNA polymerase